MGRNDEGLTRRIATCTLAGVFAPVSDQSAGGDLAAFAGRWGIEATDGKVFWLELRPDRPADGAFFGQPAVDWLG